METSMRTLILLMMMAGAANADDAEVAIKKTVFRLTTAYQCAAIINDDRPYDWAKRNAVELVGEAKAAEMIAFVESQGTDGSPLNEKFCRNMTAKFK